jgi:sialidase-1
MCGASGYHEHHSMNTVMWYSDDFGETYTVSGVLPNYQECQLVELSNGTVMVNMRNSHLNPCDCRATAVSHDGGVTWSTVSYSPDLIEPTCSAGLVGVDNQLFFSNPHETSAREAMSLMSSTNNGLNWTFEVTVWPGPAAYSTLTVLSDDGCGMLFATQ